MTRYQQTAYERNAPDASLVARSLSKTRSTVFWTEEAPAAPDLPPLQGRHDTDLTIVGGGYLGLWTAILAKRRNPNLRVTIVESKSIGWAASSRNGGFCEASITHGDQNGRQRWPDEYDRLEQLGNENLAEFEQDVLDLHIDCQWEKNGTVVFAVEEHQRPWVANAPVTYGGGELREQINSPLFLAGMFDPDTALLQPARLVRELLRVALDSGVDVFENSHVTGLDVPRSGKATVRTGTGSVSTDRIVLATNVFRPLLRRNRPMTIPVYDYILMTEPLTDAQMSSVGWVGREGLTDLANQFHYIRLTKDNRILFGGYDAIYHFGRRIKDEYANRAASYNTLASHFFALFPQLADVRFSHQWGGVIDTCTQFTAFYGLARRDRVAYAAGFTGLGVGATRFAAGVLLDKLNGEPTEATELAMIKNRPMPFPPEPIRGIGVNLTRWSLDRADHHEGRRNLFLRTTDALGLGFDS